MRSLQTKALDVQVQDAIFAEKICALSRGKLSAQLTAVATLSTKVSTVQIVASTVLSVHVHLCIQGKLQPPLLKDSGNISHQPLQCLITVNLVQWDRVWVISESSSWKTCIPEENTLYLRGSTSGMSA